MWRSVPHALPPLLPVCVCVSVSRLTKRVAMPTPCRGSFRPPPPPRAPAPLRARASVSGLGTLISVSSSRFRAPLPLLHHVHNLHDMHNGMDGIMACAAWTPWSLVPRRVRDAPHHCAHFGGLSVEKQPAVFAPWAGGRYGPVCPVRMLACLFWPYVGPVCPVCPHFPCQPPAPPFVCVCLCVYKE